MILTPMLMLYNRFNHLDFLTPSQIAYVMLIPNPKATSTNVEAIWKPFKSYVINFITVSKHTNSLVIYLSWHLFINLNLIFNKVWIGLFVCITFTILALAILNYKFQGSIKNALLANGMFVLQTIMSQSSGIVKTNSIFHHIYKPWKTEIQHWIGTLGLRKCLKLRLVMGAWCLVSVCLITAYSSVIVSFVMAPHYRPLVDTVKQLAENEDINPLVVKNMGVDIFILVCLKWNTYSFLLN